MIRKLLPVPLKRFARRNHRAFVMRRAMRKILRDPVAAVRDTACLRDLVYGWGNEGWSAENEYLEYMVKTVDALPGSGVLECGSGLSTLLLGATVMRHGGHVASLEHMPVWAARTRAALAKFGLESAATVQDAPLRSYGDFSWYEAEGITGPFAAVVCDGPPSATPGGRYGLLSVMGDRLTPGCRILLDDVARPDEQSIMKRWQKEAGVTTRVFGQAKPFAEVLLPNAQAS